MAENGHAHFYRGNFPKKLSKILQLAIKACLYSKPMFFDSRNRLEWLFKLLNHYFGSKWPRPLLPWEFSTKKFKNFTIGYQGMHILKTHVFWLDKSIKMVIIVLKSLFWHIWATPTFTVGIFPKKSKNLQMVIKACLPILKTLVFWQAKSIKMVI